MSKLAKRPHQIGVGDYASNSYTEGLVLSTLRKGRLTYGELSKQVERTFSEIHQVKHAVLCSSGTDALRIALRALKIENGWQGDFRQGIIVPTVTFVATLNVVIDEGFAPIMVDVDPVYYHLDPVLLEKELAKWDKVSFQVVGCIPVHLFGQPVDWGTIEPILKRYNVVCLEDSCECMYTQVRGQYVGGLGEVGAFSLYAAHLLTAGVGGIVTTNDDALACLARSLANHGRDGIYISIDDDKGGSQEVIKGRFRFEHRGFSSRITELQAAVALPQLKTWERDIQRRNDNARILSGLLAPYQNKLQLPQKRAGNGHSWMMYPLVLKEGNKWDLIAHLEKHGIETREMLPLTNQPVYADWLNETKYPVAKYINEQGFYIGCHPYVTETAWRYVGMVFEDYFRGMG